MPDLSKPNGSIRYRFRIKIEREAPKWRVFGPSRWHITVMSLIILRVVRKTDHDSTYLQPQTKIQHENLGES